MTRLICRALPKDPAFAVKLLNGRGQGLHASLLEAGAKVAKGASTQDVIRYLKWVEPRNPANRRLETQLRKIASCGADYTDQVPAEAGDHVVECPKCGAEHKVSRA